jgi:hypothetical protein
MNKSITFLFLCYTILFSQFSLAHHSFTMFDANNPQNLTGSVVAFNWTNPHTFVDLEVVDENGVKTIWQLEHGPKNMLSRRGWDANSFKPGDQIDVEIHPLTSGKPGGRFMSYNFIDSAKIIVERSSTIFNIPPPEPVEMPPEVAKNLNGMWVTASGGIHFDSTVAPSEQTPPLRPEYMASWKERRANAEAGRSTNDPTALCIPAGFPRFLGMVYPGEILQSDHQINWYAEWYEATVRIYLDERPQPDPLELSYNGYTTGKWNDNVLETLTIAMKADTLIDTTGVPHSEQLEVTMSIKKLTPDYMEVDVTLNDPIAFYEPWQTIKHYARAPAEFSIQEYSCSEGNRYEVTADGSVQIKFDEN